MNDFLSLVLPAEGTGWYVAFDGATKRHFYLQSLAALEAQLRAIDAAGGTAYYATATFAEKRRLATAVTAKKAFYLDIDFKDIKEPDPSSVVLDALKVFCKTYQLPAPTILVVTGGGVHIYWVLTEPIDRDTWKRYAEGLKKACIEFNFPGADHPVTADVARIMRPPGTFNRKYKPPYQIESHLCAKPTTLDRFASVATAAPVTVPPAAQALGLDAGTTYRKFWIESILQSGACPMMKRALTPEGQTRETMPEGLWADLMATCSKAEDGVFFAHAFSKLDTERYNEQAVDAKLLAWKGQQHPRSCSRLATHGQCGNCERRVSTDSPIKFGYFSPAAQTDTPPETCSPSDPSEVVYALLRQQLLHSYPEDEASFLADYRPPTKWPANYGFDPVTFETFMVSYEQDANGERVQARKRLWTGVFWPQRKLRTEQNEFTYEFVFWPSKHEKPVRQIIETDLYGTPFKIVNLLASHGFPAAMQEKQKAVGYFSRMLDLINGLSIAVPLSEAFGWDSNLAAFNFGQTYATVNEGVCVTLPALLSPHVKRYNYRMTTKGTLNDWKKAVATYEGPSREAHRFVFMAGFASILIPMTPNRMSHLIHFYSSESGSGKTSLQQAVQSIWAEPSIDRGRSTYRALIDKFSIYGNLPAVVDEITQYEPAILRQLAFDIAAGEPRARLRIDGERLAHGRPWSLIGISSGNTNIEFEMSRTGNAEGEHARVTAIRAPAGVLAHMNEPSFRLIFNNYGFAGREFVRAVLESGISAVGRLIEDQRAVLDQLYCHDDSTRSAMRYRLDIFAAILVANKLATELGLTNFEEQGMHALIGNLLTGAITTLSTPVDKLIADINNFITTQSNMLPKVKRQQDGTLVMFGRIDGMMNRGLSHIGNTMATTPRADLFIVVNDTLRSDVASIPVPALYIARGTLPFICKKAFPSIRTDPSEEMPRLLQDNDTYRFSKTSETILGIRGDYYRVTLPRAMVSVGESAPADAASRSAF